MVDSPNPKLQRSKNYAAFTPNRFNRGWDPVSAAVTERSMREKGFMPSKAIHVDSSFNIIEGHTRFRIAQKLGIEFYYIVDDTDVDILKIEYEQRNGPWNLLDFVQAIANSGNKHYDTLLQFSKEHRFTLCTAALLLENAVIKSGAMIDRLRAQQFCVKDMDHAIFVADVVAYCLEHGIKFARTSAFVSALSCCLHLSDFDLALFKKRIKSRGTTMLSRPDREGYVHEIEELYNYHTSKKFRLPLTFLVANTVLTRKRG